MLRGFTGDPGIPAPVALHRHAWSTDTHSLGTAVSLTVNADEADLANMASPLPSDQDPQLLFAGEATHVRYNGTMHGARLSGIREASRVLSKLTAVERITEELNKISQVSEWVYSSENMKERKQGNANK